MYIFPCYCAYCEHKITEIFVRSATVVRLPCNSCRTKYYQCRYCNTKASCHTKYHRLNKNHTARNKEHKKKCQEQKDT